MVQTRSIAKGFSQQHYCEFIYKAKLVSTFSIFSLANSQYLLQPHPGFVKDVRNY